MPAGKVWFFSKHIIVPYLTLDSHNSTNMYQHTHNSLCKYEPVIYLVFFCTFYTVRISNEGLTEKLAILTAGDNIQVSIQAAHNLIIIDSVTPTSNPLSSNIVYCQIPGIAENLKKHLINKIHNPSF